MAYNGFQYRPGEDIIPAGEFAKIDANLAALELVVKLEREGRKATSDEMAALAKFSGWGSVKPLVDSREARGWMLDSAYARRTKLGDYAPGLSLEQARKFIQEEYGQVADEWTSRYGHRYMRLRALLNDPVLQSNGRSAYSVVRESVLSSHYTQENICHALWDAVKRLGFQGGRIVEPSVGSGMILSAMPDEIRAMDIKVEGCDLDPIAALISKHLHPDATIHQGEFQKSEISDNSADLVIGNVPFSSGRFHQNIAGAPAMNLHNLMIANSLARLRPGGLCVVITSNSTMDNNPDERKWLADNAELVSAIRLPRSAHKKIRTEVVSDILVLRKPDGRSIPKHIWEGTIPVEIEGEEQKAWINEYFSGNPAQVIGENSLDGSMYGREKSYSVSYPENGDFDADLKAAVDRIPAVVNSSTVAVERSEEDRIAASISRVRSLKIGSVFRDEKTGRFFSVGVSATGARKPEPPPWFILRETDDFKLFVKARKAVLKEEGGKLLGVTQAVAEDAECREWTVNAEIRKEVESRGKTRFVTEIESEVVRTPKAFARKERVLKLPRGYNEKKAESLAADFIALRSAVKSVVAIDINPATTDDESAAARAELSAKYEAFVAKWGRVNLIPVREIFSTDPEVGLVLALETVRTVINDGKEELIVSPSAILSSRTIFPEPPPKKPETYQDAVLQELAETGSVTLRGVAVKMGVPSGTLAEQSGVELAILSTGIVFKDPEGGDYAPKARYLSGHIRKKLVAAESAAERDPIYLGNVAALKAVLPPRIEWDDPLLNKRIGQTWLGAELATAFARHVTGGNAELAYVSAGDKTGWVWTNEKMSTAASTAKSRMLAVPEGNLSGMDIVMAAFNAKYLKVEAEIKDSSGNIVKVIDAKATDLANSRVEQVKAEWDAFMESLSVVDKTALTDRYNDIMNSVVVPKYDGAHLQFPGLARGPGLLVPRQHQADGVMRGLQELRGLLAYDVGYGKTLTGILMSMEARRIGVSRKPMIVCDNASYAQFEATLRDHYPQANILAAAPDSMSAQNRAAFLSRVATGDWDAVIMAQSQFDLIPNSEAMEASYFREELGTVERAAMKSNSSSSRQAKMLEAARAKFEKRMERIKARGDDCLTFDKLGVDFVIIDEAHKYKRAAFVTHMDQIKGVNSASSMRGDSLMMKARYLHQLRGRGRGVVLMTATPVTNTMAEVWNMIRFCNPEALENACASSFDDFRRNYTMAVTAVELHEASNKWKMETRLSKFVNPVPFLSMVRSAFDVKNDPNEVGLVRPDLMEGKATAITTTLTPAVGDIMETVQSCWDIYSKLPTKERREASHVPLVLIGAAMTAAIDPRLIDPAAEDDPGSVINRAVEVIWRNWERTKEGRETQAVFLDRRNQMDTASLDSVLEKSGQGFSSSAPEIEIIREDEGVADDSESDVGEKATEQSHDAPVAVEVETEHVEGRFDLYLDLKKKLLEKGIPEGEVAIVQDYKTKGDLLKLFCRVNKGEVRIVIGSTQKLGVGVNIQERLLAIHHIDPPRSMTPADLQQRNGRIVRQGNENKEVAIYTYGMADTPTAGIYHRIARKAYFCAQALAGNAHGEFEDCGAQDLEELKASLISDKRLFRRAELLDELSNEKKRVEVALNGIRSLNRTKSDMEHSVEIGERSVARAKERLTAIPDMQLIPDEGVEFQFAFTPTGDFPDKTLGPVVSCVKDKEGLREAFGKHYDALAKFAEEAENKSPVIHAGVIQVEGISMDAYLSKRGADRVGGYDIVIAALDPVEKSMSYAARASTSGLSAVIQSPVSVLTCANKFADRWLKALPAAEAAFSAATAAVAEVKAELAKKVAPSSEKVEVIQGKIAEIDKDLQEKPPARLVESRFKRMKNRTADVALPVITRGGMARA